MALPARARAVPAILAVVALVFGVWMGLLRVGFALGAPPAPGTHGAMLVLGFLGTVIGMERAVATGRGWAWIAPFGAAAAVIAMLAGRPTVAAALLLVAGAALVAVFAAAYRDQPEPHIVLMGIGASGWVLAALTWALGGSVPSLVPWLSAFLVLTIAGERLELARTIGTSATARRWLWGAAAIVVAGSVLAWTSPEAGARLAGAGNLGVAAWLLTHDLARRTIHLSGVTRYMAAGLLAGYVWLGVAGALWMVSGLVPGTVAYDAALHAVFLGFVMSMIMAHAPVVVPALAGVAFPWSPVLWVPLGLLHASVLVRVAGGLAANPEVRRWGAALNAVALALFAVTVIAIVATGRKRRRAAAGHREA